MSDTDYKIPESLEKAFKAGQVVPFIGAGVSRAVEKKDKATSKSFNPLFPNWKEYVEILADTLTNEGKPNEASLVKAFVNSAKPKYLEAMQHAFEELGSPLWYEKLKVTDSHQAMVADQTDEVQKHAAANASSDKATDSERGFHDKILGAKNQVKAQYGENSDEYASLGMKKKDEYKRGRRTGSTNAVHTP